MERSSIVVALLCISALAGSPPVSAADTPATGRIPTVTRLVKLFLELEGSLATGIRSGNAAAVEKMLA